MIIAIPTLRGRLSEHFSEADAVRLFDIDMANHTARNCWDFDRPSRNEAEFPAWLKSLGVDVVLTGSIAYAIQSQLGACGIEVYSGGIDSSVDELLADYVQGRITTGRPQASAWDGLCTN